MTPRGCGPRRPTARTCSSAVMALPGLRQAEGADLRRAAGQAARRTARRLGGGGRRLRRWRATARWPTWWTRSRCRRCATSRSRRRRPPRPRLSVDGPGAARPRAAVDAGPHQGRGRMTTRLLTLPGLAAPQLLRDERCSCLRTHASCFLLRCSRTPPSSPWSSRGRPTGSLTPEDVRQASEDAAVEPRHLKALLAHLSGLGISVQRRRHQQPCVAATTSDARPRPPPRRAGQEGRRREDGRRRRPAGRQDGRQDAAPAKKAPAKKAAGRARPPTAVAAEAAGVVGPDGKKVLPDIPDEQFEKDVKTDPTIKEDEKEATFVVSDGRRHRRARAAGHGRRRDRRPGQGLPQADRQGPAAQRRDGGRARQADRGRPVLRGEARQGRQDQRRSCSRSSSGSPRTAAAPRTTCSRPTCASSSRWPSATPAAACSSST